jgi:hypothetical protein
MRAFLIQTEFPPDQIGKVYSLRVTASKASHGVGLLLAAPLFAWADVSAAIGIAGGIMVLTFGIALLRVREPPPGLPRDRESSPASS